jgi:hypothetical protein
MPISRPSCHRSAALGAAFILLLPAAAPAAQDKSSPGAARTAIEAEGQQAADRLRATIAAQRETVPTSLAPVLPKLPEAPQRRAFDGLHRRFTSPAIDQRAKAAATSSHADLEAQRAVMAKRIGQALGLEAPAQEALAGAAAIPANSPSARSGFVPIIFASSSMPMAELRAYAAQLEPVGGVIAFRGIPGGLRRVGPMAKLSAQMLRVDPGCEGPACIMRRVQVIVDPVVFRQHGVTRVPALTLVPGDPTRPYCEREEDSPLGTQLVYGDAALSGLLEEYARLGGEKEVADVQARMARR